MPGVTHWQSPTFFAFFPATASGPSMLGELIAAGLGVQGMMWATSPACTELETHVLDWMLRAFILQKAGRGLIFDVTAEVMTHLAFYVGWPNVFSALPVAKEVFEKRLH